MPTDVQRIQAVFLPAAAIGDPDERARFLDGACDGDTGLRARVEALLRAHDRPDSLLDHPAVAPHDPDAGDTRTHAHEAGVPPDDDEVPLGFLAPGTRPDSLGRIGHYEVLQVLGKGGFGIVFRAFDDVLQRVVAVKVLSPQMAATSPARKRFLREARSSAQVRHENVVQVYEVGEQPLPYIAMEFIPGETLQQRLDRTGPVEVADVLRVGRQVAEGLAAAHATDLIHRDIKPGNVLLEGGTQRVKITDFGLARAADDASISQSGIIAGTPMFMAPEQARGETLDQRADLFSLGSVLYQMAAGHPPFRANGTLAVLKRVAEDTPRPIREVIPETPQWLCDIIAKLHAKVPDERYQSAREVADVLADCETQLKENAKLRDYGRIPRGKAQPRGRRKWVAAAAVLLLPVLALAVTESAGVTNLFRGMQPASEPMAEGGELARPTDAPPPARVALEFDGIKDCVATPLVYDGSTPLTVEATVQISEWPVHKEKYHAEIVGCTEHAGFGLGTSKEGFYLSALIGTNYATAYSPKDDRYLNRPIKLTGVIEAKLLRLFIDGKQVARNSFEHDFKPSPERISLGTSPGRGQPNDGNGYDWAGKMFEVRISNKARYRGDYDASAPLTADGNTLALYQFDEGTGDILHDTSGKGQHGRIIGARWVNVGRAAVRPTEPTPSTFQNGIGMEFVIVPKGKSWLGGGKDRPGDKAVAIPADFYLGKYEVTQEEWEKVMGVNPSHFSRKGDGKGAVKDISDADLKRFPVENVSWDQCQVFVAKMNERDKESGWVYRLPKQIEWEYACRGGPMADKADSAFDFYLARPTNTLSPDQANYEHDKGLGRTCKVGSYEPNRLGLFDIHGNVWEWCDDLVDPKGWSRVDRGGSCMSEPGHALASHFFVYQSSTRYSHLGLRLVRVPSGAAPPEAKMPPVAAAPFTDAEVQRIAALPAAEQVAEVRKELLRRNPNFDGKIKHKIEDGVVTELQINADQVTDISPIRVFNALRVLVCEGMIKDLRGKINFADLSPLKGMNLADLTELRLNWTRVDDAGMILFKDCRKLKVLNLYKTQVSDAGLAHFNNCNNLAFLSLGMTAVSDVGLAHFKDCKNLTHIELPHARRVSDVGVAHFKDCSGLEFLDLAGTRVSDATLAQIKDKHGRLTFLNLDGTAISDAGLANLRECKSLNKLYLHNTKITDAGLAHVKDYKNLTFLALNNTKATDLALLKNLPLKEINCDFDPKRDSEILRSMITLEKINDKPAEEFWKDVEKK